MKKRTFLKTSSALLTGGLLSPLMMCKTKEPGRLNWAGNYEYKAEELLTPDSMAAAKSLVSKSSHIKALGTRHSFNSIADSPASQINMGKLNEIVNMDKTLHQVTIESGMTYGKLSPLLQEQGYALHNLASLPHISVAGAIATGTHGSGVANGNLSTAVVAIEFIDAGGNVVRLSKTENHDEFNGAVIGLGALGVITKVTLSLQPAFDAVQNVYLQLPLSQLESHFQEIMSAGYSVSLFTDWKSESINQVWVKNKVTPGNEIKARTEFYGASVASRNVHPIIEISAENCTDQMGVPGPWYERLPHFKMNFTPSSGKELQSEYFVPYAQGVEAIKAIHQIREQVSPLLQITEIRTIDADEFWMSPCYKQASMAIHFTWKQDWDGVGKLLPVVEKQLAPFNVRPHWGKLFRIGASQLQKSYPMVSDFKNLMKKYDPQQKFRNQFLEETILG